VKSQIRIRIKVKILEPERLKMEPGRAVDAHNGGVKFKMEAWRVCRLLVADSHHFDEGQDPNSYPQ
jgi:hypothetical protein